jgi:hypothetical protein
MIASSSDQLELASNDEDVVHHNGSLSKGNDSSFDLDASGTGRVAMESETMLMKLIESDY